MAQDEPVPFCDRNVQNTSGGIALNDEPVPKEKEIKGLEEEMSFDDTAFNRRRTRSSLRLKEEALLCEKENNDVVGENEFQSNGDKESSDLPYSLRKRRRSKQIESSSEDEQPTRTRRRSRRQEPTCTPPPRQRSLRSNRVSQLQEDHVSSTGDDEQSSARDGRYSFRDREKSTRHFFTYSSFTQEGRNSDAGMDDDDEGDEAVGERYERETRSKPRTTRNSLRAASAIEDLNDDESLSRNGDDDETPSKEILRRRYSLRNRTQTKRLEAGSSSGRKVHSTDPFLEYAKRIERCTGGRRSCERKYHKKPRRRHYDSSSESSRGGQDSEDAGFYRGERRRRTRELNSIQPLGDASGSKMLSKDAMKADVAPLEIDRSITWDSIGGMDKHKASLKEMVMLPLMYPEFFEKYHIMPPCGVLFYGPPGTGKTLVARALANSCTTPDGNGQQVTFFMRKGADCLSKWVGEAERQLRLLFEQAKRCQPSIIFFDEIDGLAPVRSTKQDQIHASIVSTLLALMDGLDSRGNVVVIGATNRVDAIDPALRRPGRFDRELAFTLPTTADRKKILDIQTCKWNPRPRPEFVRHIAELTVGYCGADLKALCAESALRALRRRYPQIYASQQKLIINIDSVKVLRMDFDKAMHAMTPASHRAAISCSAPIPKQLECLLNHQVETIFARILQQLPVLREETAVVESQDYDEEKQEFEVYGIINRDECDVCQGVGELLCCDFCPAAFHMPCLLTVASIPTDSELNCDTKWACSNCLERKNSSTGIQESSKKQLLSTQMTYHPRLLIHGTKGMGQAHLGPAIIHQLEGLMVFTLALPQLIADPNASSPEESLVRCIREAKRSVPCILFLPQIELWWENVSSTMQTSLRMLLGDISSSLPLLFLATSNVSIDDLPSEIVNLFYAPDHLYSLVSPCRSAREELFSAVVKTFWIPPPPPVVRKSKKQEILLVAPQPMKSTSPTKEEILRDLDRERHFLRELRIFLDQALDFCTSQKRYAVFVKPVDEEDVPDYYEIIDKPMCLETMAEKLADGDYLCLEDFLADIQKIVTNAQEYNPRNSSTRIIAHTAVNMRDNILSYAHRFKKVQGYDLFQKCHDIATRIRTRKATSKKKIVPDGPIRGIASDFNTLTPSGTRSSRRIRGISAPLELDSGVSDVDIQHTHTTTGSKEISPDETFTKFSEGDQVFVASRTTPGVNKRGGAALITFWDKEYDLYSVKYILGGSEKSIAPQHISSLTDDRVANSFRMASSSLEINEESQPKTGKQLSFDYFNDHIWCHLKNAGWVRQKQDEECEFFFPPGITKENGVASEDYFTEWENLNRYVKTNREIAEKCFGRRYVLDNFTPEADEMDIESSEENVDVQNEEEEEKQAPDMTPDEGETLTDIQTTSETDIVSNEELIVDELKLKQLLQDLVDRTDGHSVDDLHALQVELYQMAYPYRLQYDRTLLSEMLKIRVRSLKF